MIEQKYKRQVNLLLKVLPEVSKESSFALHGGTAINLFVRNMPDCLLILIFLYSK